MRFSRRILCLAAMLARSSTVVGLVLRSLGEGGWESSTLRRTDFMPRQAVFNGGGNVLAALYSPAEGVWSADCGIDPPLKISDVMSNLFNKLATTYPFITVIYR